MCTYTNVAVDNLLEGFINAGLKPLRVGFEGKAKAGLGEYMLEHQFDMHPLRRAFERVAKEQGELVEAKKDLEMGIKETLKKSGDIHLERLGVCYVII